jgi:RNA polymerase sigma-70 factor (ECF subfamily)
MAEFADQIELELPHLRRYARFLERDVGRADDLVHDAVVRALRFRDRFRPDTNLRAWLITIVHNVFVNQVRSVSRNMRSLDSEQVPLPHSNPSQEVAVLVDEVSHAMLRLSPEHREIIWLCCVEELPYAQVADTLEIAVGTVRSRLNRARTQLRRLMTDPNLRPESDFLFSRPSAQENSTAA